MTTTIKAVVAAGAAVLLLAGCSGGSGAGSAAGGSADAGVQSGRAEPAGPGSGAGASRQEAQDGGTVAEPADAQPDLGRDVIQTAELTVHADDVGTALTQARSIVQGAGGVVSAEHTSGAIDEEERRSVLTLRVPADRFADVLDRFAGLGALQQQQTSTEDVTLQVIDVEARIASAERALARLRELLDRAQDLSDIVSLEDELLRREADLEALKAQHAYLADQASLSTVTLTLLQRPADAPPDEERAGFLGGLGAGWDALVGALGVAATVLGAVLPFLLLLGVLLAPAWLLLRRTRVWRRSTG